MQKVSLKILQDLAKAKGTVVEYEVGGDFGYDDFVKAYGLEMKKSKDALNSKENHDLYDMTYEEMKRKWLKAHCPPIAYIAEGSSRAVYACAGGKCLKIAVNVKGTAQNKVEFTTADEGKTQEWSCFAMTYGADRKTWGSLLTECCSEVDARLLQELYDPEQLLFNGNDVFKMLTQELLEQAIDVHFSLPAMQHEFEAKCQRVTTDFWRNRFQFLLEFVKKVRKASESKTAEPEYKVFADLFDFYHAHGRTDTALCIDDLMEIENWGMAIRGGKIVPVIIDPGLDDQVYADHYSS